MPRKGPASRRPLTPDPIYQSQLVTQMVNKILLQGKRSTAERIVYSALEQRRRKTGNDPVTTLKRAVENVRPVLETKSRRVGGATYQVPVEVRQGRSTTLALRWLVNFSRARREKTMAAWPASCWTPRTAPAPPSSARKTPTRWPRPTGPSRTTAGSTRDN